MAGQTLRRRRVGFVLSVLLLLIAGLLAETQQRTPQPSTLSTTPAADVLADTSTARLLAANELERLSVKGRAPKTGYKRSEFGDGWARVEGCDMRNIILGRYMIDAQKDDDGCVVFSGILQDPYTAKSINFIRGAETSDDVQIDHVVALSDAWQKGAQQLTYEQRVQFANDPLNLLPVDGRTNQDKGDSDAASWLPPNKAFRCQYVARQIAVKVKYGLWVTEAEKGAMIRVLKGCGEQVLPVESQPNP